MSSTFKIRGKCEGCRKQKWFIQTRKVMLPIGKVATSHDLFCSNCYKAVKKEVCQKN